MDKIYERRLPQSKWIGNLLGYRLKENDLLHDQEINFTYSIQSDIGYSLYLYKKFEQEEIDFVLKKLEQIKSPVIFDIGANIGLHSIMWAKKSGCKIFAFEPSRSTSKLLSENILLHQLENNISISSLAFSDKKGTADFFQSVDDGYSSLKDTHRKEIISKYQVEVTTIDDFVDKLGITKIDMIKIDVEGLEREVLSGGFKTFEKFSPDLFVEVYGGTNSNTNPELTVRMMIEKGYKAYVFKQGNLELFASHSDEFYNYYFTKL